MFRKVHTLKGVWARKTQDTKKDRMPSELAVIHDYSRCVCKVQKNRVWALVGFDFSRDYFYQKLQSLDTQIIQTKQKIARLKNRYSLGGVLGGAEPPPRAGGLPIVFLPN